MNVEHSSLKLLKVQNAWQCEIVIGGPPPSKSCKTNQQPAEIENKCFMVETLSNRISTSVLHKPQTSKSKYLWNSCEI